MYMTNESIRLKNKKRRLWKQYLASRSRHDREMYIKCKNDLRNLTRKLRNDFERNLAGMVKSKPKAFWRYAKSRLKTKPLIPSLSKSDGSKASTPKDKAETMNHYFSSVFTLENMQYMPDITCVVEDVLQTIEITPDVVRKRLLNLDSNKSPGHDQWHPYFLKELADDICTPLSI